MPNIDKLHVRAAAGDSRDEAQLFDYLRERFHLLLLYKVEDRDAAEDIVQEALMAIARDYKTAVFHSGFAAWAYTVLNYRVKAYRKIVSKHRERFATPDQEINSTRRDSTNPTLRSNLLECLRELSRSNRRYARIVNLHHQGYSTVEICHKLHMTANAFYIALMRARDMLQECLDRGKST
jgi:RNA polymerase sigma factor (sigma-70 family)